MWWENIGVVGRAAVFISIQVIACFIFGGWGLLVFPVLYILISVWLHLSGRV